MKAVDVYLMYCALKAHFKGDYDYHKFSGQTKIKRDSFWKRKDRLFFVKVGYKYEDGEDGGYDEGDDTMKMKMDLMMNRHGTQPCSWKRPNTNIQ